jgi:nucleotide-binding universal stress UspA family protein
MAATKRMLVPTDFSPASDVAFAYAIDLAVREGSAIYLLHVIDGASFAPAFPEGFYVEMPLLRQQLIDEATVRLQTMAATCKAAGITATVETSVGWPARVIAETATARNTELIVMGTHGRGGFAHLAVGSVAERVVRTAPCAVLTVRDTPRVADAIAAQAVTHRGAAPQPA